MAYRDRVIRHGKAAWRMCRGNGAMLSPCLYCAFSCPAKSPPPWINCEKGWFFKSVRVTGPVNDNAKEQKKT